VTRHGKRSPRAATPIVPATAIRAPFARTLTDRVNIAGGKQRFHRPPRAKSRSLHPPRRDRRPNVAIIALGQKPKSPYIVDAAPRVPAWAVFVRQKASENLHHKGRPAALFCFSKADIAAAMATDPNAQIAGVRRCRGERAKTDPKHTFLFGLGTEGLRQYRTFRIV